ncbi:TolC family protein [Piscinibacter defluvii]|uniref:TolC family protein n=1 Tax=Piscinibacter defluvii TaxID=1796922 RepID=UPI000FDE01AB|nr:TolC family protein [Piscinibacter defluvii]
MRFPLLALAFVLAASTVPASAQTAGSGPLTLTEALRLAEAASPAVRAREAQLVAAEGSRREAASLLFNNPELSVERTRRSAATPDGNAREWGLGIAQPIEIGGQQARRREAASASLEALRAEIEDARRQARAEASLRFHAVLAAQRRVRLEQRSVELFDGTAQAVARRRSAGEDTRLDANVALIEAERARNALAVSQEHLQDTKADLATALQLPPSAVPEVIGDLGVPNGAPLPYGLDQLLASAQALPRQRALAAREDAARARVGVERASRYPDVTVGLNVGREGPADGRERVTTLTLSVPLPLFKRNDAAIGQAMSDATQAEIERAAATRDGQAQVRRLWSRLDSQRERVARLQRAMVAASADNQQLAAKSRQAGQIGLLDQLLVNRQALDAERDLNDALAEFHTTRIELENAAGWSREGTSQ